MHISRSHTSKSHMWNADTLSHYLTFLKDEVRRKRQSLNLPFHARALIICDAATVHSTAMYQKLREAFERETNSILLHGANSLISTSNSRLSIPGGWGACGAPNDAWHQWFHYMRRGYMRLATGMSASTALRRALCEFDVSIDGNPRYQQLARFQ